MEVTHELGVLSIKKEAGGNIGFLLTNKKGSYCSFFSTPSSRYHGLFYFDEKTMDMYKLIENIELVGYGNPTGLKNKFYFVERKKGDINELFLMPKNHNSLFYCLNKESEIDLILDCRMSYDNREWGRHYAVSEEGGCIVIKFTKRTDLREDRSSGTKEFELYLAIKSDSPYYKKNDEWVERHYTYDEERASPPFKRHVYNSLRLRGKLFVFSMSKTRNAAVSECSSIFADIGGMKSREKSLFMEFLRKEPITRMLKNKGISHKIKIAYINAFNSLGNLALDAKNRCGLIAGLPWLFQFWPRDTLISLNALYKIDSMLAKKILFGFLGRISDEGRLPPVDGNPASLHFVNADAHGWLFLRCSKIVEEISKKKGAIASVRNSVALIRQNRNACRRKIKECLKKCSLAIRKRENELHRMHYEVESSLEKSIDRLLKFHTKEGFETNGAKETWMDTDFEDGGRKGARIEIQALRLNMYRLMFEMGGSQKYKVLENTLKEKLRHKFWNGAWLADGAGDFAIRPNIFIAAYSYPGLLSNGEWSVCLGNALKSLWLEWGGLSTIDKNNPLFTPSSTGENPKSYHRGDSWFWINNMAALVLYRINEKKFGENIKKIIDAGAEEILWKGCIGCHSELSSAGELSSKGCFSQAWSSAMYIEAVDEIFFGEKQKT